MSNLLPTDLPILLYEPQSPYSTLSLFSNQSHSLLHETQHSSHSFPLSDRSLPITGQSQNSPQDTVRSSPDHLIKNTQDQQTSFKKMSQQIDPLEDQVDQQNKSAQSQQNNGGKKQTNPEQREHNNSFEESKYKNYISFIYNYQISQLQVQLCQKQSQKPNSQQEEFIEELWIPPFFATAIKSLSNFRKSKNQQKYQIFFKQVWKVKKNQQEQKYIKQMKEKIEKLNGSQIECLIAFLKQKVSQGNLLNLQILSSYQSWKNFIQKTFNQETFNSYVDNQKQKLGYNLQLKEKQQKKSEYKYFFAELLQIFQYTHQFPYCLTWIQLNKSLQSDIFKPTKIIQIIKNFCTTDQTWEEILKRIQYPDFTNTFCDQQEWISLLYEKIEVIRIQFQGFKHKYTEQKVEQAKIYDEFSSTLKINFQRTVDIIYRHSLEKIKKKKKEKAQNIEKGEKADLKQLPLKRKSPVSLTKEKYLHQAQLDQEKSSISEQKVIWSRQVKGMEFICVLIYLCIYKGGNASKQKKQLKKFCKEKLKKKMERDEMEKKQVQQFEKISQKAQPEQFCLCCFFDQLNLIPQKQPANDSLVYITQSNDSPENFLERQVILDQPVYMNLNSGMGSINNEQYEDNLQIAYICRQKSHQ